MGILYVCFMFLSFVFRGIELGVWGCEEDMRRLGGGEKAPMGTSFQLQYYVKRIFFVFCICFWYTYLFYSLIFEIGFK